MKKLVFSIFMNMLVEIEISILIYHTMVFLYDFYDGFDMNIIVP